MPQLNPHNNLCSSYHDPHFSDEKTKAQKNQQTSKRFQNACSSQCTAYIKMLSPLPKLPCLDEIGLRKELRENSMNKKLNFLG